MGREPKTVKIAALIDRVNDLNRAGTDSPEVRRGWNSLLEDTLDAGGFTFGWLYLTSKEVPKGQEPGVRHRGDGVTELPDSTRRQYH